MNKKILFLTTFTLLLMIGGFSCNSAGQGTPSSSDSIAVNKEIGEKAIVYINSDTLINKYQLFIDMKAKYEEKANKINGELTSKGRSFESRAIDFQQKVQKGLVTRAQAEEMNGNLEKEQQNILSYRDKVLSELNEEEQVMLNNVQFNIHEFLKKYNEQKKYSLILNTNSMTNNVMIGDENLDITLDVLEGLNKEYNEKLPKK